jgi:hypothetical protein
LFAATENDTVPAPDPEDPPVMLKNEFPLLADQAQPGGAFTATVPLEAAGGKLVADGVKR